METICKKCQIPFSGKNAKNITSLSSAELAKRVVKVKELAPCIMINNILPVIS